MRNIADLNQNYLHRGVARGQWGRGHASNRRLSWFLREKWDVGRIICQKIWTVLRATTKKEKGPAFWEKSVHPGSFYSPQCRILAMPLHIQNLVLILVTIKAVFSFPKCHENSSVLLWVGPILQTECKLFWLIMSS